MKNKTIFMVVNKNIEDEFVQNIQDGCYYTDKEEALFNLTENFTDTDKLVLVEIAPKIINKYKVNYGLQKIK